MMDFFFSIEPRPSHTYLPGMGDTRIVRVFKEDKNQSRSIDSKFITYHEKTPSLQLFFHQVFV